MLKKIGKGLSNMYHIIILISALMLAMQFLFNDGYKREEGSGFNQSLRFTFYSSLAGFVLLLFTNSFHFEISIFSSALAFIHSLLVIGISYNSIKALKYANLSVYSIFLMVGGMLLPFVFGIICGESITFIKVLCFLVITVSVILPIEKGEKSTPKAYKYYFANFFLNGLGGIILKIHQMYPEYAVDSGSFLMASKVFSIIVVSALLLTSQDKKFAVSKKAFFFSIGYDTLNSFANLFIMIALLHIPASVQSPITTGTVIVFSVLIDKIRKVEVSKRQLLAAVIAFVSIIFISI